MSEEDFQALINEIDEPDYSDINIEDLKLLTHEEIMKFDPTGESTERLEAFDYWLAVDYKGPVPKHIRQELNKQ